MQVSELILEFETALNQERKRSSELYLKNRELQMSNDQLICEIDDLKKLIENEHPVIKEWIEAFKRHEIQYSNLQDKVSKKDKEIQKLKEDLAKSEKFNSDHIIFLMEALRREPLRVVIETD